MASLKWHSLSSSSLPCVVRWSRLERDERGKRGSAVVVAAATTTTAEVVTDKQNLKDNFPAPLNVNFFS